MINHKIPNQDLIDVYTDTLSQSSKMNPGTTTKHFTKEIIKYLFERTPESFEGKNIIVENSDTVSSFVNWSKSGKTCLLNMASYKRPGGGVDRGARAQEECLFRCSNLSNSISTDFYPLEDDSCLYTKNATFYKDFKYNNIEPIIGDVMTIAAINLNSEHPFYQHQKDSPYKETTLEKIRLMLTIPIKNGVDNLILGSWGCGVFKNDPQRMAQFFKQVLIDEGYSLKYKNIVFAIINDHNSVGSNYEIFSEIFDK